MHLRAEASSRTPRLHRLPADLGSDCCQSIAQLAADVRMYRHKYSDER